MGVNSAGPAGKSCRLATKRRRFGPVSAARRLLLSACRFVTCTRPRPGSSPRRSPRPLLATTTVRMVTDFCSSFISGSSRTNRYNATTIGKPELAASLSISSTHTTPCSRTVRSDRNQKHDRRRPYVAPLPAGRSPRSQVLRPAPRPRPNRYRPGIVGRGSSGPRRADPKHQGGPAPAGKIFASSTSLTHSKGNPAGASLGLGRAARTKIDRVDPDRAPVSPGPRTRIRARAGSGRPRQAPRVSTKDPAPGNGRVRPLPGAARPRPLLPAPRWPAPAPARPASGPACPAGAGAGSGHARLTQEKRGGIPPPSRSRPG